MMYYTDEVSPACQLVFTGVPVLSIKNVKLMNSDDIIMVRLSVLVADWTGKS